MDGKELEFKAGNRLKWDWERVRKGRKIPAAREAQAAMRRRVYFMVEAAQTYQCWCPAVDSFYLLCQISHAALASPRLSKEKSKKAKTKSGFLRYNRETTVSHAHPERKHRALRIANEIANKSFHSKKAPISATSIAFTDHSVATSKLISGISPHNDPSR